MLQLQPRVSASHWLQHVCPVVLCSAHGAGNPHAPPAFVLPHALMYHLAHVQIMTPGQFTALYTAAGVTGAIASNTFHRVMRVAGACPLSPLLNAQHTCPLSMRVRVCVSVTVPSLGASGCIFGIITYLLAAFPQMQASTCASLFVLTCA